MPRDGSAVVAALRRIRRRRPAVFSNDLGRFVRAYSVRDWQQASITFAALEKIRGAIGAKSDAPVEDGARAETTTVSAVAAAE
jgi:hypothetical protein